MDNDRQEDDWYRAERRYLYLGKLSYPKGFNGNSVMVHRMCRPYTHTCWQDL